MIRPKRSRRAILAVLAIAVTALIAFFPMRLALGLSGLDERGFSAREVAGTIWQGRLIGARAGALPLGDLDAGLRFMPLLSGAAELQLSRPADGATAGFTALISSQSGALSVREANGSVPLGSSLAPLPAASVSFTDFSARFADGRCSTAKGEVRLALSSLGPMLPLQGAMAGKARCSGDALLVPMTGPTGMEKLNLRIEADGQWHSELILAGLPVEVTTVLFNAGFGAAPGGAVRIEGRGRF